MSGEKSIEDLGKIEEIDSTRTEDEIQGSRRIWEEKRERQ